MKRKAFTLVELLVVIAIVGLLSTVAVVALGSARMNARNMKRKADLVQISKALELYFSDNDSYPLQSTGFFGNCPGAPNPDTGPTGWIPNLAPTYIGVLPHDINTGKQPTSLNPICQGAAGNTCYKYRSDGTDYKVIALCTPEGTMLSTDPFYDYAASGRGTMSWAIYTPGAKTW